MPRETLNIGPTPAEESCEQVGEGYDVRRAKQECRRFITALESYHGHPPVGARYKITTERHDFGTYHEVGIEYDPENQAAVEYAFMVEGNTPGSWEECESKLPKDRPAPDGVECAST